ncbi:MAG: DUF721 domain-containing protein [bacterium]|nr:DUF721 domain-containing protein [bacterium]
MTFHTLGSNSNNTQVLKKMLKVQVEASYILEYASEALIELFGKEQAYHAKPLFLKNRTLTISCATATTAQDIREKQTEIVDKINEKIGKKEVDSIRYLA